MAGILIVRLGALGDVLLGLPALRLLRASLPDHRISWLVEERNAEVLRENPDLTEVFTARADSWRRNKLSASTRRQFFDLIRRLRQERFDVAIDLQGLMKSAAWSVLSGAEVRLGLHPSRTRESLSGLLAHRRADSPGDGEHVSDAYVAAAETAVALLHGTVASGSFVGRLHLRDSEFRWAAEAVLAAGISGPYVVVNPGASWPTKLWPAERFGALAARIVDDHDLSVFVAFGPGEESLAEEVVATSQNSRVVSFPSDVRQLAAVLAGSRLYVGGDTGPYHLAAAVGTPTVALFGPTDPRRNGRWQSGDPVLWERLPCSPCYGRRCATEIECMAAISIDAVAEKCRSVLDASYSIRYT